MICAKCGANVSEGNKFCAACGNAVDDGGGPAAEYEAQAVKKLKTARGWILAIGILYAVSPFLMLAIAGVSPAQAWRFPMGKLLLLSNFALCAIHIGLFFWAASQPFAAAVVGLSLFVTVQLINVAMEPKSITQGIIVKILFLTALIGAVRAGLEARRLRAAMATARAPASA